MRSAFLIDSGQHAQSNLSKCIPGLCNNAKLHVQDAIGGQRDQTKQLRRVQSQPCGPRVQGLRDFFENANSKSARSVKVHAASVSMGYQPQRPRKIAEFPPSGKIFSFGCRSCLKNSIQKEHLTSRLALKALHGLHHQDNFLYVSFHPVDSCR